MARDYEIGYGRPPKHTQFKKGQSGNPEGRPKGIKSLSTELDDELSPVDKRYLGDPEAAEKAAQAVANQAKG